MIFRNGLRPSRFYVLKDNIMVMASEVGVYDTEPENVALKVSIFLLCNFIDVKCRIFIFISQSKN